MVAAKSEAHGIPETALDKHIAILGKTGAGKSNLAKLIAEDLLARQRRVAVIDPTGVWWGLRLMADGSSAGHSCVIFGGQHGDLPLSVSHGEAIAKVVSTTSTRSLLCCSTMKWTTAVVKRRSYAVGYPDWREI